jgi:AcrR family transcriptional regulator
LTRRRITEAAAEEFLEKGYDQAYTRDIAARAGLSEALVFKYFGTKDALYAAAFAALLERHAAAAQAVGEASAPGAWLGRLAHDVVAPGDRPLPLADIIGHGLRLQLSHQTLEVAAGFDLEALLRPVVAAAQASGEWRRDLRAAALTAVYWRFVLGCVVSEAAFPADDPGVTVDAFLAALAPSDS